MIELTQEQISDYLRRSFFSVDGIWFMKVEEKYGFESTLDIDETDVLWSWTQSVFIENVRQVKKKIFVRKCNVVIHNSSSMNLT